MQVAAWTVMAIAILPALTGPCYGQERWQRVIGGAGDDWGVCVQQTTDGGYIVAGTTSSVHAGDTSVYLIKTSPAGETTWTRTYGGPGDYEGHWVERTSDSGYIVAGVAAPRGSGDTAFYVVKTNALGDTLWTRTYGGPSEDVGYCVRQTADHGFIMAGLTYSFGAAKGNAYVIRTDAAGDTFWTRRLGGTSGAYGYSVQQTTDGGYIVSGAYEMLESLRIDLYLVKLNASGDTLWSRTYGGPGLNMGFEVEQTADSGYILTGALGLVGGDLYLVKTNGVGDTQWTRRYHGQFGASGSSVQQLPSGGYVVVGWTAESDTGNEDVYLVRTDADGETLWTRAYGGGANDFGSVVRQTTDGGYIIAGETRSFGSGDADVYLIKTDASGSAAVAESPTARERVRLAAATIVRGSLLTTTPVSVGWQTTILLDATGRRVLDLHPGANDVRGLAPGVYFVREAQAQAQAQAVHKVVVTR